MFIVMPIPRVRQAPEERHGPGACRSLTHMPLLRSLAGLEKSRCYKHGAPNGVFRRLETFRTGSVSGDACKVHRGRAHCAAV
jgi:hypothetical protein